MLYDCTKKKNLRIKRLYPWAVRYPISSEFRCVLQILVPREYWLLTWPTAAIDGVRLKNQDGIVCINLNE